MAYLNRIFNIIRLVVFGVASLFSLIVIILGGVFTNFTDTKFRVFYSFAALAIATGLLTILTLPVMLTLSVIRKGAFTSMIAVEVGWTSFLWIMWLAVGASSASVSVAGVILIGNCSLFISSVQSACNEAAAITAFGFLTWILLTFYTVLLITLTFRQQFRGNVVWTGEVTETDFTAPGGNSQAVYESKATPTFASQYPPTDTSVPVAQQQTPGSYNGQFASPYPPTGPTAYPQV